MEMSSESQTWDDNVADVRFDMSKKRHHNQAFINWGDSTEAEHKAHKIAFTFFGAFTNV